jgi:hypothetical protein
MRFMIVTGLYDRMVFFVLLMSHAPTESDSWYLETYEMVMNNVLFLEKTRLEIWREVLHFVANFL